MDSVKGSELQKLYKHRKDSKNLPGEISSTTIRRKLNRPDVWFDPQIHNQVWEVAAQEVSLSPSHAAVKKKTFSNTEKSSFGLSLRFPRFLQFRTDKNVNTATAADEIASVYLATKQRNNEENN
eukprot:GSMAST32.ASY1.ANO1.1123.1 assembled CDS